MNKTLVASPSRERALEVLLTLENERVDPAALLHRAPSSLSKLGQLSKKDHDLTHELVYGVLRFRARLDFVLNHYSHRPVDSLTPSVRIILRLGAYQILHLDRIPQRAAVDESVKLAHEHAPKVSARFVNAVLRNLCRNPSGPKFPGRDDPAGFLSITHSHPPWLAKRYLSTLGLEKAEARARWNNQRPTTFARIRPPFDTSGAVTELEGEGVEAVPVDAIPGCVRLIEGSAQETALFKNESIRIQDAGSQLVAWMVQPTAGQTVLDVCAAPGGKAQAIADRCPDCFVIASDVSHGRIRTLKRLNSPRHGLVPMVSDMAQLALNAEFPWILCDAPCSNLGTLARNPDIKWNFRAKDLKPLAHRQRETLVALTKRLAPGGYLIYATCSTASEENEEVVEAVLRREVGLSIQNAKTVLPKQAHGFVDETGFLRIVPEQHAMDGYFGALLKRQ